MQTVVFLFIYIYCGVLAHQEWKISKAMKNNLSARKESLEEKKQLNAEYGEYNQARMKMENIEPKSVHDLQSIFPPVGGKCKNKMQRNLSNILEGKCVSYEPRWVNSYCYLRIHQLKY